MPENPDVRTREETLESIVRRADPNFYRERNHVVDYKFSNGVEKYNDRSGETGGYEVINIIVDDLYVPIVDDFGRAILAE